MDPLFSDHAPVRRRSRRRLSAILIGLSSSALLIATAGVTLSGFNSTIVNPTNTFNSATIVLKEAQGATTCDSTGGTNSVTVANSYNCTTINAFGTVANAAPGATASTTSLTFTNAGTLAASTFTMTPGACSAAANTGTSPYSGAGTATFCSHVNVTVHDDSANKCIYPSNAGGACPALANTSTLAGLGGLGSTSLGALAANGTKTLTITTQLDSGVATNADQGLTGTMQFSWILNQ